MCGSARWSCAFDPNVRSVPPYPFYTLDSQQGDLLMSSTLFEALESRRHFAVTPAPGNWNLQWADEFNSSPTTPKWVQTLWGMTKVGGELENYTPNNVSASGGLLNLTAKPQLSNGMPYTSGLIDTGGDFATVGNNQ